MNKEILKNLLLKVNSMSEFHNISAGLSNTSDVGDFFELFTKLYFQSKYLSEFSEVWLLDEIPKKVLDTLNMKRSDRGIDLLAKYRDEEKYVSIQSKYRSNQGRLTLEEINSFNSYSFASDLNSELIEKGIVFTTAMTPINQSERPRISFIEKGDLDIFDGWSNIHDLIKNVESKPKEIIKPYKFQKGIIDELVKFYSEGGEKAKMILPCGTGKTFISYWIMKTLSPKKVLIAAPSIALVKQILDEWNERFLDDKKFPKILVVCSDKSVQNDSYISSVSEIIHKTTTDKNDIKAFLTRKDEFQIVISTYQSSQTLIDAASETQTAFDFAIYDEAHRTVGRKNSVFSQLTHNKNIIIKQRLFMTATERIYSGSKDEILSMDDHSVYGKKTVSRTFKEILNLGSESPIIDYEILTLEISKDEILSIWNDNPYITYDPNDPNAEEELRIISTAILQKKLYSDHGVRLSISFHSALRRADKLVKVMEKLKMSNDYPDIETFFIEGRQNSSIKKDILNNFSNSNNAIITNARCLTEGVDVTSVDAVIFSDPKKSTIDIVQACGRALRKSRNFTPRKNMQSQKGIIVVPLIVESDDLDEIKQSEPYKKVIDVIKALATQDERIIEYFRDINTSKKGGDGGGGFGDGGGIINTIGISSQEILDSINFEVWTRIASLNPRPFKEARAFVRTLGLRSQKEWIEYAQSDQKPKDIPLAAWNTYKNRGWINLPDWLGSGVIATRDRVFLPFEEAREYVRALKLKNQKEWSKWSSSVDRPMNIPSLPSETYKYKGWINYGDWLGTGSIHSHDTIYLPYDEASKIIQDAGIKTQSQWRSWRKKNKDSGVPSQPEKVYKDKGWTSWGNWTGTGVVAPQDRVFLPFEEAREYMRSLKLKNQKEYREFAKSDKFPDDIPRSPERVYKDKGWINFGDWIGTFRIASQGRVYLSFEQAREYVRALKLKNQKEWILYTRSGEKPDNIPSKPERVYKDKGWINLGDWLGTFRVADKDRVFLPFEEAREYVRSLNFKNREDWRKFTRSKNLPKNLPKVPERVYKDKGWINLGDWLGTFRVADKDRVFLPFEEAREYVRKLKLKNQKEWIEYAKSDQKPEDIPRAPWNTYKNKGWINLADWLGK